MGMRKGGNSFYILSLASDSTLSRNSVYVGEGGRTKESRCIRLPGDVFPSAAIFDVSSTFKKEKRTGSDLLV